MIADTHYFDHILDRHAIKLLPGEYAVSGGGRVLVTVLGSCVAACVRDERQLIGGMNHFMLPAGDSREASFYGVHAMELLINELIKAGSQRADLTVKVFGGAAVLQNIKSAHVGSQNADFIRAFLRDERLRVLAEDLYGTYPRKVYFFPETGEVRVNYLREFKNSTIAQREREYATRLKRAPQGTVEEF